MDPATSAATLWWTFVFSGIYHGLNPGMGWPLAVSAAMMERKPSRLWRALAALVGGHLLSMMAILLPFTALLWLVVYQRQTQIAAALLVIALSVYLTINRRHPRFLARAQPMQLALWSFLVAPPMVQG